MVADVWGAGELHNRAGGSYRYRGDGDSLVMFKIGLQVVGDEGDRCLFWGRDNGASDQEQLQTGCLRGAEVQSAGKLSQATRAAGKQRFGGCVLRGTLTHTSSNKRFLGKTHQFPELEKGPRIGSEVPQILPAGPKSQKLLPRTHPARSLLAWLMPVSLKPEHLATPAAPLHIRAPSPGGKKGDPRASQIGTVEVGSRGRGRDTGS